MSSEAATTVGLAVWLEPYESRRLIPPSPKTMAKYGLTPASWEKIAARQGFVCAICKKVPKTGRLCIDHFHAPKWKHMQPAERALHVRGLLCFFCNKYYCGRGITIDKAQNLVEYLKQPKPFNAAFAGRPP